jgi:hypothetical protein
MSQHGPSAARRMLLLLVAFLLVELLIVTFVRRPYFWAAIVSVMVPVLTVPVVIMPIHRARRK